MDYDYPGNVRELMNVCERLVVMSDTEVIDLQDLPHQLASHSDEASLTTTGWPQEMTLEQILESVERTVLADAVKEHGNQYRVADFLGINQSTVARKLKKYGLC
jgi:DNA-binding NtrC family response regulator